MLFFEFKTYGKARQFQAIDEAIRTTQFIRNKAIRLWMEGHAKSWVELSRHCALLAKEFPFADKLNSMARQAAADAVKLARYVITSNDVVVYVSEAGRS